MNRRDFMKKTGMAVGLMLTANAYAVSKTVLSNASVTIKAGQQNNILVIFADQMHGFAMSCMGHPDVKTPNLDWLASEGTLFRNSYSQSPVCTPFRCCLLTGRYGSQTGVLRNQQPIPAGERTFADAFNDGGYRTSYVGKWHLGNTGNVAVPESQRGGFTDFIGYEAYNDFIDGVKFFDEDGNYTPTTDHRTKETTDITMQRLANMTDEKFAMVVSYQNPHYPEQPTLKYEKLYDRSKLRSVYTCQCGNAYVYGWPGRLQKRLGSVFAAVLCDGHAIGCQFRTVVRGVEAAWALG